MSDLPDDWNERLDALQRRADRAQFDQIIAAQTWPGEIPTSGERIPAPGECHPYYAANRYLRDWINRPDAGLWVNVLKPRRINLIDIHSDGPPDISQDTITLTRRRCYAAAPYVGRPFVYIWEFAADELGRAVAADDAHMLYTDGGPS